MKLNVFAFAAGGAVLWGLSVLCVGLVHLAAPEYGTAFLALIGSLYPGFQGGGSVSNVLLGTAYAIVDGAIGAALLAWIYNLGVAVTLRERGERTVEPANDLRHPAH